MKFFRVWAMCLIIVMGGLLSGCGNTTMLEEYSFGYTQLKSENSEVFLMTPFQLGKANRQNGDGVMYVGNDTHINLMAISEPAKEITVQKLAETSRTMLEQTPDISNLQTKVNETTVNGKPAVETEYTYEEPLHGKNTKLDVRSLFFEDNGQIWHVMYMYRDGDAMGKEVTDYIFGKIKSY